MNNSEATSKYQELQDGLEALVMTRQRLETQLQENKIVSDEFRRLDQNTTIYKLTGSVLLPVEQSEANLNVEKRLEFIQDEINRCENNIKNKQNELNQVRAQLVAK